MEIKRVCRNCGSAACFKIHPIDLCKIPSACWFCGEYYSVSIAKNELKKIAQEAKPCG